VIFVRMNAGAREQMVFPGRIRAGDDGVADRV